MIETGNLRRGVVIEYENAIYRLEDVKHIKMGRGGAVVRLKLRHVQDGHIIDAHVRCRCALSSNSA